MAQNVGCGPNILRKWLGKHCFHIYIFRQRVVIGGEESRDCWTGLQIP
jgi:hypothetical protein